MLYIVDIIQDVKIIARFGISIPLGLLNIDKLLIISKVARFGLSCLESVATSGGKPMFYCLTYSPVLP